MMLKSLVLGTILALTASVSHAVVINFETATTDVFTTTQRYDGFDWVFSAAGWFVGPGDRAICPACTSDGTSRLVAGGDYNNHTATVSLTKSDGSLFDLNSLDSATANIGELNQLSILGTFANGSTIQKIIDIDGTFDAYALSGFSGLSHVVFSSVNSGTYNFGGFSLDNVALNQVMVPEPSALALLGIGLACIGYTRRKNT